MRGIKVICFFSFFIFSAAFSSYGGNIEMCFHDASAMYNVNVDLLKSIAKVESGYNQRAVNINKDGTRDYGIMQINSTWRKVIGERAWFFVVNDACYNIKVGAWILSLNINKEGNNWGAVGSYNARSYKKKLAYIRKVHRTYLSISKQNTTNDKNT